MGEKLITLLSIAAIGAVVTVGRFLLSKEKFSLRILTGKAIVGAALGLMSYPAAFVLTALLPIPGALELQVLIGICCALAVGGVEVLEKIIDTALDKWKNK